MSEDVCILTDDQKAAVHRIYGEDPNLISLTQKVFDNPELDGRSKEGRAIREYLVEQGLKYRTTKKDAPQELILLDHQKKFITQNCRTMTAFQMAKVLFPNENINTVLCKEVKTIVDYVRETEPDKIKASESALGIEYRPPITISEAVAIINIATTQEIFINKLSTHQKQCIQAYIRFINSPRLIQIINSYSDQSDRDLFQSEFTRFTWDKPDLNADDVSLYIGVCQDLVENKRLIRHKEKLNQMFENVEGNDELSVRLADTIKAKADEYDKVQKRIESALKKLNGDRAERLRSQGERTANFLALVEAFQEEEERKRLLLIAKAHREKIKLEADRLESLDDFKARILGVSKSEVL